MKTVRDTDDIRTLSWPNIVKSTKQMKILDILSTMFYIWKNIESIENLNDGFLIATFPNILRKEKNEIGLTVYELKTKMRKKSIPPQNEQTIPKPWNHDSHVCSQYPEMIVKLMLKWKNENMQIWSRYSLFKNTNCRLPASSSAALNHYANRRRLILLMLLSGNQPHWEQTCISHKSPSNH